MPQWVLFQRPSPERLVRLSNSSRSPVTTSKQRLDDDQVDSGICATCAPPRCWPSDHLFSFPCSSTPWVTPSVVNEPAAHVTVRLCHAITAVRFGYYENSGTVSLSTCRPSHVPLRKNVLARRRCPTHALQCPHWASPITQGVPRAKVEPVARDGVGIQTWYRRVCRCTASH